MTQLQISDTTFRDAHQSLIATRLSIEDMTPIASLMDSVGYYSMEVWGGATFDTTHRFLNEDPWERLRSLKKLITKTPLSMLLRGQSLVGYRVYSDDIVDTFVKCAADTGIDIFRVFDSLNDERNILQAAKSIKETGKHLQLTLCYSVGEEKHLGGSIYNLEYYAQKATTLYEMGADSICIKDMAGLLSPYDAFVLISKLKEILPCPLQLHTHYSSGMASMTLLKAIEAGIDTVDTCLAPLALRTSQPAIEPLIVSLQNTQYQIDLDLNLINKIGQQLEKSLLKYRDYFDTEKSAVIDTGVLSHQIPGGMYSNLISQLKENNAIDKLSQVLLEVSETRRDLGYPPLVTPMSQMIGAQAVNNVLFGRYKMITDQIKDYVYGMYGQSPAAINPDVSKKALENYTKGKNPITNRPADNLSPELNNAKEEIKSLTRDLHDVLIYALFPTTGLKFLEKKYSDKPLIPQKPPEHIETPIQPNLKITSSPQKTKSKKTKAYNISIGEDTFLVEVDPLNMDSIQNPSLDQAPVTSDQEMIPNSIPVKINMPGIILKFFVEVGQVIKKGDPIILLESMKMETTIPSPESGTIVAINTEVGMTITNQTIIMLLKE